MIVVLCLVLTALELGAAVLAKGGALLAGLVTFGALFGVYALSLRVGSLTSVTVWWICCSQVAAVALDAGVYGHRVTARVAAGTALVLAGTLLCSGGDHVAA